jgi:hypothetical protein
MARSLFEAGAQLVSQPPAPEVKADDARNMGASTANSQSFLWNRRFTLRIAMGYTM